MQDLEARLKQLLAGIPDGEQAILIREMKAIALESYRNGQQAAAPTAQTKEQKRETANPAPAKHYKR
jgi:hypothetical protein